MVSGAVFELARILFEKPDTMILDEPTNHLDADSIVWLRDYLKTYEGGLMIISHDLDLIDEVVNIVFFLDATRQVIGYLFHGLPGVSETT